MLAAWLQRVFCYVMTPCSQLIKQLMLSDKWFMNARGRGKTCNGLPSDSHSLTITFLDLSWLSIKFQTNLFEKFDSIFCYLSA